MGEYKKLKEKQEKIILNVLGRGKSITDLERTTPYTWKTIQTIVKRLKSRGKIKQKTVKRNSKKKRKHKVTLYRKKSKW